MPNVSAKLAREALFSDEDPLMLMIPGVGEWRLSDFEVNPPVEDDVSPDRSPLLYLVETLGRMVREEPGTAEGTTPLGDDLRQKLADALRDEKVNIEQIQDLLEGVADAWDTAARVRGSKASGRPTRRRRR